MNSTAQKTQVLPQLSQIVVNNRGEEIGKVKVIIHDTKTEQPKWIAIDRGSSSVHVDVVPVGFLSFTGTELKLPYDTETINSSPKTHHANTLNERDERLLENYYHVTEMDAVHPAERIYTVDSSASPLHAEQLNARCATPI